jgi:hypothetical protein
MQFIERFNSDRKDENSKNVKKANTVSNKDVDRIISQEFEY